MLTYVDERLGPRVFVTRRTSTATTAQVLIPEMQKRGQQPPPLEDVRDDIRETLKQQKITQEIPSWTRELREKADVVIYSGQPAGQPLPPVVKTIQGPEDRGEEENRGEEAAPALIQLRVLLPGPPGPGGRSRGCRRCRAW